MTQTLATTELSEAELVRLMLACDERAWREFLRRYERLLQAAIAKVLRRFARADSSHVLDDVYSTVLSSLCSRDMHKLRAFEFERGYRLSTWLSLLATNAAWDHVRATRRYHKSIDPTFDGANAPYVDDIVSTLIARDECRRMTGVLSLLSARDREFFDLVYLHRATPQEIAAKMGISIKTVYTKKHKVRSRCASALRSF